MSRFYWVKSYYRKRHFLFLSYFFSFCSPLLEARSLILGQIWGHLSERALKELSNVLFRGAVALWFTSYVAICRKMLKTPKCDLCLTYVQPMLTRFFTWLKNDRISFVMIFDTLLNAAYCVSLHGPEAELEAWGQIPPGPACSAPSTGPARNKNLRHKKM